MTAASTLERIALSELGDTAYKARAIADLAINSAEMDETETQGVLIAIRALAIEIHDSIDAFCRGRGDMPIGYMDKLRAKLDDDLRAATHKKAGS